MSSYTPLTNFAAKDALLTGDPAKKIKGTEVSAEFSAIQTAIASKADSTGTISTATNLAGGAAASIPYQSGASTTAFLANGTAGQLLKSNGTTVAPSWTTPSTTVIQPISATVGSNALTITAGALSLDFRSSTLSSGTVTTVTGTPSSLVVSSGSTLGTTSGTQATLAVLAINNAGTIELAVGNILTLTSLNESGLISTVAEGGVGTADSAGVFYSTTARTNVAYRIIGFLKITQATAGLWATAPSTIQGAGGVSVSSLIPDTPAVQIQPISASVAANALTISSSSLTLDFRSTTAGSGTVTTVTGTPSNLVISSGSTLGTSNGVLSRVAVLAINNAGTIELAAVNAFGGVVLDESSVISTTAEGGAGAADSGTTIYSTTARSNVAYRVLGYIDSTQATAGTWASSPSKVQGMSGDLLTSFDSIGIDQSWGAASSSGTNNTGRPQFWSGLLRSVGGTMSATVGGVSVVNLTGWTGYLGCSFIIPPGVSWSVSADGGITSSGFLS